MIIYPAMDLLAGNCVRLYQGQYQHETVYSASPIDTAQAFLAQGASWLHVVDLEGAKDPRTNQASLIKTLLQALPMQVQVGGGIRTKAQIDAYFAAGARRVVLGSLVIQSPSQVIQWLQHYGANQIVLAFDIRFQDGRPYVMTEAWQQWNATLLFDVVRHFSDHGLQHILCTDIHKDGALTGPNIDLYQQLCTSFPQLQIQASGGISHLDDLRRLKALHVAGAITGRALYEKKFNLSEALSC